MKSTSISTQLKLGFLLVVALFLLLIGLAAWRAHEVSAANRRMAHSVELLVLAERWQAAVKQNSARSLAVAYANDGAMLEFFKGAMAATTRETTEIQNGFLQQLADKESRDRADNVIAVRKVWLAARDQINALRAAGDKEGARALVQSRFVGVSDDYVKVTQTLVDGERAHIAAAQAEVGALFRQLYAAGAALSALAIACTLYISSRLGKRIREGIDLVLAHALQIGRGDLTQRIETAGSDEIAQLMKALATMQASLIRIVDEVHSGARAIALASEEISSGNSYLSSRTEAQACLLQKTSASMNALAQAVQTNVDNARQTGQIVTGATEVAQQGGAVMADVVETMSAIQQSSEKIVDIIGVINSIAFQTNILALNAAVEAARAGEQGRGFAVVAAEVRSLAQSSATAAKQIKELIDNSVAGVADGNRLAATAGATMNKVVASIHHVQAIMGEVDQATLRQGQSIAEINQAIVEMDDMTRQNAALVGQAGAASDSLRQQIAALTGAAGNFKTSPSGVPAASATDTRAVAGATTFPPLSSSITT